MDKQQFKKLQSKWYKKLKREGFIDIEYRDGSLKLDGRKDTVGFQNQDLIRDRFSWIENIYKCPKDDKAVIDLYCRGIHLNVIAIQCKKTYAQIRYIIKRAHNAYKNSTSY